VTVPETVPAAIARPIVAPPVTTATVAFVDAVRVPEAMICRLVPLNAIAYPCCIL
jgi:hypothetical protein